MKIPSRRHTKRVRGLNVENLESRELLAASPMISEFLARNDGGLRDGDGRSSDWIELYNAGDEPVDLAGYHLTDDAGDRTKWTFPSVVIEPGNFLVVFASGKDFGRFVDSAGNLHTNFTLRRSGEYLGLIAPTGEVISQFGSALEDYPEQMINISYGTAQKSDLITRGSPVRYALPADVSIDNLWMLPEFDAAAHGFLEGTAAIGFEQQPESRTSFAGLFDTEVPATTHAVYARYEFSLLDASAVSGLQLSLMYDDGFIAYLNGQRILAENAPETASLFSSALDRRSDNDATVPQVFDLSEHAGLLVDGTNVLAIHGLNHLNDRGDFLLVPALQAVSGGTRLADGSVPRVGYMTTPTPGMPNSPNPEVYDGFVLDTRFSQDRGFYDEPFTVEITTESSDAQIRYTLDSSTPTETHGTVYTGPIEITTTTTLRAAAFKPGFLASDVDTQTYIFLDDVLRQPSNPAGFPARWGRAGAADYEMDPRVTTDVSSPYYSPRVRDALLTHPTISIVTDVDNLFDADTGIYSNPQSDGVAWERPASMEFFDPNSGREIQVNAGLRIQGGASRNPNRPKHNMRLLFKGDYGPTKLQFPLFEETDVEQFDTFIVRGQNGDSWFHPDVNSRDPQYIRDQWLRDTQRAMGRPTPAQDHVHLYLNGLYWGFYNIIEKPNASYFADHFGGEKEEYDVLQHQGGTVDGNRDAWNEMMAIARRGLESDEAVQSVGQYVDVDGLIDYLLINFYAGNVDWDQNNWFGGRRRDPDGRFVFFTWDAERTFLNVNENVTTKNVSNQPTELHQRLTDNAEYRLQFADHVHRHFFNDGLLTPAQVEARWLRWADEIESALWAESARFGDAKRAQPYTPDVQWITDLNKFREDYFPRRTDVVLGQLRSRGLYPDVVAPSFNQHGGFVTDGFPVDITAPEGTIYYTTDGSDPRLPGGAVAPAAAVYAESFPVTNVTTVKSRVLLDGQWSALNEATFQTASRLPLRITEINFNPYSDRQFSGPGAETVDSDRFEFVELTNVGSQTINLAGVKLEQHELNGRPQGIRFQFSAQTLLPGARVVVASDVDAFVQRYGETPRLAAGADGEDGQPGQYGGNLSNEGEQITLVDAEGRIIQQFAYGFSGDWPARADGRGSSLEIIEPFGNASDPANWRASLDFGGSPGSAGSTAGSDVAFNELLASPIAPDGDLIELRNSTATDIDVGGWYLSDTDGDYLRYRIPDFSVVPASGFFTIDARQLGLDLDGLRGGVVNLTQADASGRPKRFVDRVAYGSSFPGTSLGPVSTGSTQWILLNDPTFGSENSGRFVSDVVITEIHANPVDPDGERRGFDAKDFQYVELTNHSTQPVDVSGWSLDGDIQFSVPDGTALEPGESVPVMAFRASDTGRLGVFRFTSGLGPAARVLGRFRGELAVDEGLVQLKRPIDPSGRDGAEVVIESVPYRATSPWPDATSVGQSLHRIQPRDAPELSISWLAGPASPGKYDAVDRILGDSNHDGVFDRLDIVAVLERGRYMTGEPAAWEDGDWNGDGVFDQRDVVFALQRGSF